MNRRKDLILLYLSVAAFLADAVMLVLIAFSGRGDDGGLTATGFILGGCFWALLCAGAALQIIVSLDVRRWRKMTRRMRRGMKYRPRLGLISFFKSLPGAASDVIFPLSAAAFAASWATSGGTSLICYVSLALMFFSFCTHCIFNGKNHYYAVNCERIEESCKRKPEETK